MEYKPTNIQKLMLRNIDKIFWKRFFGNFSNTKLKIK